MEQPWRWRAGFRVSPNPRLHTLRVVWKRAELDTSGICPRLQVLHGDLFTINAFLPGRRVTSLKWTPSIDELPLHDSIDHLSEEFQHIRFFSFGGAGAHPWLNLVICHLRAVEVLEIVGFGSLAVQVFEQFFSATMYTFSLTIPWVQELQLVSKIPRLRILILSNRPGHLEDFESYQSCKEYFPRLFASCSALQHIHVGVKHELPLYRSWSRHHFPPRNNKFEVKEVLLPEWNISSPFMWPLRCVEIFLYMTIYLVRISLSTESQWLFKTLKLRVLILSKSTSRAQRFLNPRSRYFASCRPLQHREWL